MTQRIRGERSARFSHFKGAHPCRPRKNAAPRGVSWGCCSVGCDVGAFSFDYAASKAHSKGWPTRRATRRAYSSLRSKSRDLEL